MKAPSPSPCPQCGAALPDDAPGGLCPRCLVNLNFGTQTVLASEPDDSVRAALSPEEIAPHFPQLEILACLGRGGMGVVYRARQRALGRDVALKLLAPEREKDPQFAERFTREAQALARLDHPHIVTVHDFGQVSGFFYLLMEFVDGVNLRHLLRTRKLTPEEALAIIPPLCDALQFAHDRGIVHRDIKPENLLLAKDGRVKIADFGIAKMMGAEVVAAEENAAGTPGYMAPEQRETPGLTDSRADIFSLGVVFYEMLTGELPAHDLQAPSTRLRGVKIDVRIDEIVLRALENEPSRRYQTAAELGAEVQTVTAGSNAQMPMLPPQRPFSTMRALVAAGLLLPLCAALALFVFPKAVRHRAAWHHRPRAHLVFRPPSCITRRRGTAPTSARAPIGCILSSITRTGLRPPRKQK